MKKLLAALMVLGLMGTVASADAVKGQKLYLKKLKGKCGFSGAAMAGKHTQGEWEELMEDGKIADEIKAICPKVKNVKESNIQHYFDFFHEYGSDSGNVPSC